MSSKYRIFLEVKETGSFSVASNNLGYSQSAISQAVRSLEEELETKLLIRKREGLSLTQDGLDYLPYIEALVSSEENLQKKKKEKDGLMNEVIRIGTFTSVSRNLLPQLLSSFHKIYPDVKFELRQGEYDNIHTWLLNGEVDFAFINPEGFEDIDYKVIYHDTMKAVLWKEHPLEKKKVIHLKDLVQEPFILLDEGKKSVALDAFEKYDLHPEIAYKVYDDYSILEMVKQQMGISLMYELVLAGFEKGVSIRAIKEPVERTIALACKNPETLSYSAKQLYQYILRKVPKVLEEHGIRV